MAAAIQVIPIRLPMSNAYLVKGERPILVDLVENRRWLAAMRVTAKKERNPQVFGIPLSRTRRQVW